MSAFCIKKPTSGAFVRSRSRAAGPPKASFQPSGLWPESRSSRRRRSCATMPREMRGSSQAAVIVVAPWESSVAFGRNFVASSFERSGAAPTPDQDDVFRAGVVETVPVAARREDHITLGARLAAGVRVAEPASFDHHEKFVGVGMAMLVV